MPPTIVEGNLWDERDHADVLLVTTNATLRRDDYALVMGRGAALQAARLWPKLPCLLGHELRELGPDFWQHANTGRARYPYWLAFTYQVPEPHRPSGMPLMVGAFQVKYHFKEPAEPELIANSALRLAENLKLGWDEKLPPRVAMNFPGIGFGQLTEEEVLPLLDPLPTYVRVYRYGKER